METFLEYLSDATSRREDLTHKEIELLLQARDKLSTTEYGEELFDNSDSLSDPYLWIKLPEDVGGGARIYIIFGSLALRLQQEPGSHPVGKALKIKGLEKDPESDSEQEIAPLDRIKKKVNKSLDPDFSVLDRLIGEIQLIIKQIRNSRKELENRRPKSFSPGADATFSPFWDTKDPAPLL